MQGKGAYYNEWDPYAAQWLRNLIAAGHLPPGDVDERDMREVDPHELHGYTQWHFFAGIGGWPYALRLAGWRDEWPVLTGSPPCQPFSVAGKRKGVNDERHLAPVWLEFVRELRPPVIFGEQVANAVALHNWLDDLFDALEMDGYATGAVISPACSVGAPHVRQRLWFFADCLGKGTGAQSESDWSNPGNVGNASSQGLEEREGVRKDNGKGLKTAQRAGGNASSMADTNSQRGNRAAAGNIEAGRALPTGGSSNAGNMADANSKRRQRERQVQQRPPEADWSSNTTPDRPYATHGGWEAADWILGRDLLWRPIEPSLEPLVNGVPARVGRLRAYGNAIVPQVAAEIVRAWMDVRGHLTRATEGCMLNTNGGNHA